jgi:GNAT superfamily N-acetyltransferase
MLIINKRYFDWSPAMRRQLRSLSLRGEGDMCKVLAKKTCDTFVVFDNNIIVGWAIYSEDPWYKAEPGDFMLYVRKSYRKKGVGRMLIRAASQKYGKLLIHPWNTNSGRFFAKMLGESDDLEVVRGSDWLNV